MTQLRVALYAKNSDMAFDSANVNSLKEAKEFAKGRGGEYTMKFYTVFDDSHQEWFNVKNDRFYKAD